MIKNFLAALGLVSLSLAIVIVIKMQPIMERLDSFDDKAMDTYMGFVDKLLKSGSAVDAMIVKYEVADDVTVEDLDTSILSIANELNIKNVGELPLSKQVEAMSGKSYRYVKIYLLCNAMTAASMLNYNDAFSSFLPCRISVIEDETGKLWIYTLDMDLMIYGGQPIPPALKAEAITVRDTLNEIMERAAEGDF